MNIPGLTGELIESCFRGADLGLAVGGALSVVQRAAGRRCRVQPPSVTSLWKDADIPKAFVTTGIVLVGPRGPGVVEAAESLLADVDVDAGEARNRSNLIVWQQPFLSPTFADSYHLLVPASGVVSQGGDSLSGPLVPRLRAISVGTEVMLATMDSLATEAYGGLIRQWMHDFAEQGDLNPLSDRVERWMNVAALLAIGVDHKRPAITHEVLAAALRIAVVNHEVARAWLAAPGTGVPVH